MLRLSENIAFFRKKKKITQEELANFVGVSKASVSKWENGQSMPDILILPQLAAFFDVTIDELIGYEPQLSKEQIMRKYRELANNFVTMPFLEVMEESRKMVQKYYSCYPFLYQVSVLWLNHYMLAGEGKQQEILEEILKLCEHVLKNCKDIQICKNTTAIQGISNLQLGRHEKVVEILEEVVHMEQMNMQLEGVLTQAYLMGQKKEKAEETVQASMYMNLLSLMSNGIEYLQIHTDNLEVCEETIKRFEQLVESFGLKELHPNVCAQFHYQAAIIYGIFQEDEKTIVMLKKYIKDVHRLMLIDKVTLHGDAFFNKLEKWMEQDESYIGAVRETELIWNNAIEAFGNPCFDHIRDRKEFKQMKKELEGGKIHGN
ncbi:MAG: helix-turn-helix transcriptional regulator [Lachnospiraceae bacterium]|nr:helix-turn-helix transcriptional regulator [Lachnospiraceae bacterium]